MLARGLRAVTRVTEGEAADPSRVGQRCNVLLGLVPAVRSGARSSASTAAILHGILVGPIAPTMEQRASIVAPTLVLAHRNDLIHPFDDAVRLAAVLPNAELLRTWSSVELRLFPRRIIGRVLDFVDDLPDSPSASVVEGGA